jgi:hypothetical protein
MVYFFCVLCFWHVCVCVCVYNMNEGINAFFFEKDFYYLFRWITNWNQLKSLVEIFMVVLYLVILNFLRDMLRNWSSFVTLQIYVFKFIFKIKLIPCAFLVYVFNYHLSEIDMLVSVVYSCFTSLGVSTAIF